MIDIDTTKLMRSDYTLSQKKLNASRKRAYLLGQYNT
jgi:hypothetical protein